MDNPCGKVYNFNMRRFSNYLVPKADRLLAELVCSQPGGCQRCKRWSAVFDPAHIFSRQYKSTRWVTDNVLKLCHECHLWAHANPREFERFVRDLLGDDKYERLRSRAKTEIVKANVKEIVKELEARLLNEPQPAHTRRLTIL